MAGNVRGNLVLVNALAPQMISRNDGSIIFMSSIAARRGSALLPLYSISKGAVDLAMRSLAHTLGPHNINVNSINPGPVRTDFSRDALWGNPDREKALSASIPIRLDPGTAHCIGVWRTWRTWRQVRVSATPPARRSDTARRTPSGASSRMRGQSA